MVGKIIPQKEDKRLIGGNNNAPQQKIYVMRGFVGNRTKVEVKEF
jgi:hypothetical protein